MFEAIIKRDEFEEDYTYIVVTEIGENQLACVGTYNNFDEADIVARKLKKEGNKSGVLGIDIDFKRVETYL